MLSQKRLHLLHTYHRHSYQHIITGARSPERKDFFGGIIADDMGLGKSLTMLSAIVGTLNNAVNHACSMTTGPYDPGRNIVAAKSTLIIVPSACRFLCLLCKGTNPVMTWASI